MKKILNLTGLHKMTKEEQQEIKGAARSRPYCGGPRRCCVTTGSGFTFCDYGYCQSNGSCIWA